MLAAAAAELETMQDALDACVDYGCENEPGFESGPSAGGSCLAKAAAAGAVTASGGAFVAASHLAIATGALGVGAVIGLGIMAGVSVGVSAVIVREAISCYRNQVNPPVWFPAIESVG